MTPQCFDWENFKHDGGSSYSRSSDRHTLDFTSEPPRPLKQWHFVHLYRNGPLEIRGNPYRQPDVMRELHAKLGLDFRLWSDLGGLHIFGPDWRPIRKGAAEVVCVLLDPNHNLIITPTWRDPTIYYSPTAWPSGGKSISFATPNKDRAKQLKMVLCEQLALAHTYYTLMRTMDTHEHLRGRSAEQYVRDFLGGGALEIQPGKDGLALYELGRYVANREIDTRIARWTEDKGESTWLRFKPK